MTENIENDMVYLVYHYNDKEPQFQGVFTTEPKAVAACRGELYCVCPAKLDEELPEELCDWPGAYYPHRYKGRL